MTRELIWAVAAGVTLGSMLVVVSGVSAFRRAPHGTGRLLAVICLLVYGAAMMFRLVPSPVARGPLILLAGAAGAFLLAGGLRSYGAVMTFIGVAAIVDVASMSGGLSRGLIDAYRRGTSELLLYLAVSVPLRGRTLPIVGIGDLWVGGAVIAAMLRLDSRRAAVVVAAATALLGALAFGFWRGGAPAIPFIAAAVITLGLTHGRPGPE